MSNKLIKKTKGQSLGPITMQIHTSRKKSNPAPSKEPTRAELDRIFSTQTGCAYVMALVQTTKANMEKEALKFAQKEYEKRFCQEIDDHETQAFTACLVALGIALREAYSEEGRPTLGWRKAFRGMYSALADVQDKYPDEKLFERFTELQNEVKEKEGWESVLLETDNQRANANLPGFNRYAYYENDEIFDSMTKWDCYEEGIHLGDAISNYINTVTFVYVLSQDKRCTPNYIADKIQRANEMAHDAGQDLGKLMQLTKDMEKYGIYVPESTLADFKIYCEREVEYKDRWKKSIEEQKQMRHEEKGATIGERIKYAMETTRWKKKHLAKRLNVTQTTLDRWLSDGRNPSLKEIVQLADVLGTTTDFLLMATDIYERKAK